MIDLSNNFEVLTLQDRKNILNRALHAQNFFNLLEFTVDANSVYNAYSAKANVDKDFYLTSVVTNFTDYLDKLGLQISIANRGSTIFSYIPENLLPTTIQGFGARDHVFAVNESFYDEQVEIMPYLIKRNDGIVGKSYYFSNIAPVTPLAPRVALAGYYPLGTAYLNQNVTQAVNESFKRKPRYEYWPIEITADGNQIKLLNNDRFPRHVLGFGMLAGNEGFIPTITAIITDVYRGIKFNNIPIPFQMIAASNPIDQASTAFGVPHDDVHINYLPIEHFWQPYAPLKFELGVTLEREYTLGAKIYMLTRTV